jgi:hypothetical protein
MSVPIPSHDPFQFNLEETIHMRDNSHVNNRLSISSNSDYYCRNLQDQTLKNVHPLWSHQNIAVLRVPQE